MPQFVTKMTPAEMAEESKKATQEAMRNLTTQLTDVQPEECYLSDSDNDILFQRKRFRKPETESVEKLESRIYYMKLDISNLTVDLTNCKDELTDVKRHFNTLKQINNDLEYLDKLDFYLKDINEFSIEQLEKKYKLFVDEDNEHAQLCMSNIMRIEDLPEVKSAMILALTSKRTKNKVVDHEIRYAINRKRIIILTQVSTTVSLFILILSLILNYYIKKIE